MKALRVTLQDGRVLIYWSKGSDYNVAAVELVDIPEQPVPPDRPEVEEIFEMEPRVEVRTCHGKGTS